MLDEYKLKTSDDEKIKDIIDKINTGNLYYSFVSSQEKGFIRFMDYIFNTINTLKQKAKISPYVEIRARIKNFESAYKNYSNERLLDDVFGMEIICYDENEINTIKNELEKDLKSTRTKIHNKQNGYKASHMSYSAKNKKSEEKWGLSEIDVPAVECQFKTIAVELNPEASHHDYKRVNKFEAQKLLEEKALIIGKDIPRMWISSDGGMRELEYKEIIQKIYPFVDVTTIKEQDDITYKIKE